MSRARKRADRIREKVAILDVLALYGYEVSPGYDGEQQFRCDLHGTGRDNAPSARVYPATNSTFCWGCDKTRDPISYVVDKEGIPFMEALDRMERHHGLPPLPWDDDDRTPAPQAQPGLVDALNAMFDTSATLDEDRHRVGRFLENVTRDRDLDLDTVTRMWEAFDKVSYLAEQNQVPHAKAQQVLNDLLHRAKQRLIG